MLDPHAYFVHFPSLLVVRAGLFPPYQPIIPETKQSFKENAEAERRSLPTLRAQELFNVQKLRADI
jgi:hypothetical protein